MPIVDVDGSYLYKKHHELSHSGVPVPHLDPPSSPPITGWETVTEKNVGSIATRLSVVTLGMCDLLFFNLFWHHHYHNYYYYYIIGTLYTYLACGVVVPRQ